MSSFVNFFPIFDIFLIVRNFSFRTLHQSLWFPASILREMIQLPLNFRTLLTTRYEVPANRSKTPVAQIGSYVWALHVRGNIVYESLCMLVRVECHWPYLIGLLCYFMISSAKIMKVSQKFLVKLPAFIPRETRFSLSDLQHLRPLYVHYLSQHANDSIRSKNSLFCSQSLEDKIYTQSLALQDSVIQLIMQCLMQQKYLTEPLLSDVPNGVIVPDVSDMPSEISYFFVLPWKEPKIIWRDEVPHVLTYTGDPTLSDLMDKYRSETGFAPPNANQYNFCLTSTLKLNPNFTIRDLKKNLARDSLDGIFLCPEYSTGNPDEEEYIDECCVTDYFFNEKEYGWRKNFWLRIEISLGGCPNPEVLYLGSHPNDSKESLLNRLLQEISKLYGLKNLDKQRIIDVSYISEAGDKPQKLKDERFVRQKLYNESTVFVRLSNPKKEGLERINAPKYNSWMVIYKENESEPIRVKYDEIANLTVAGLYRSRLQFKESARRRDAVYCLKIMDRILTPQEKINSAELYFKNKDPNKPLNVVAKVVNEKMIFYKVIPALAAEKKSEFKLTELTIPPKQQKHRKECERTVRLRAEKAPHQYFKIAENVEPIVIYTSELMYVDKDEKRDLVIYQSLNKYLRETPILSLQEQAFQKEWRLRYASTLLKHLERTLPFEGNTWRGITYDPCLSQKDVGTVLTFKQFTSTSKFRQTAVSFAKKYSAKQPYHLFAFTIKTGRSIIEYSLYGEGEILLEPYTEFELLGVITTSIDGSQFKIYQMEERITSKLLPGIKANFVVWIDTNPKEGKAIFSKVQLPAQTTVFEQFKSTSELQQWLGRHKGLFSDKSANLLFITNMSRPEQDGFNEYAGIDAAKLIRQHSKEVPIFFYIGNVQTTINKLATKKMNLYKLFVGDSPKEVYNFLENNIATSV